MIRVIAAVFVFAAMSLPLRAEIKVQEITSPGGIEAWLVEEHSIPFVALEIRFRGGTSLDAEGKRGAVYMMTGLLEEGAGDLDAQGFARAREALAADFSFDAHGDAIRISATFLTENREASVDLLRSALVSPRFDKDAVDRVRAQIVSIIAGDLKDPDEIARNAFDSLAFGDHPYGTPSTGTNDSVNRMTREDMVEAHAGALARDRVYVAAVGDISASELGPLIDHLLGDLPLTGAPIPPRVAPQVTGGTTVIDFPAPQSVAVFGHAGIRLDDPDFFAAYVMNRVLGASGFTSRLANEVREKRGLTYGVYSYLATYDLSELFLGSVASANTKIAEALAVIRDEWRKMAENGITAEELDAAKTYLTGAYPLRFDGNARIASILVGMQMDGYAPDYIATRNDRVEAVTLEDVARVAKRLLKPDALRVVVVGQPVGVESTD